MSARIHPTAIVESGAQLGADVEIGPYCIVSGQAILGERVRLLSHVVITGHVEVGARTEIWPFAVLGGLPQISNYVDADTRLLVGSDCLIREHATLHRGSTRQDGVTRLGDGCLLMGQVHVGHDCVVGDRVILAQGATLGGHSDIADEAFVGGHAAVHQFCRVGKAAFIGGLCAATRDVAPYALANGSPGRIMGANFRGLLRRKLEKPRIRAIRDAFRVVFEGDGVLQDRIDRLVEQSPGFPEVADLQAFLAASGKRPLMTREAAE